MEELSHDSTAQWDVWRTYSLSKSFPHTARHWTGALMGLTRERVFQGLLALPAMKTEVLTSGCLLPIVK